MKGQNETHLAHVTVGHDALQFGRRPQRPSVHLQDDVTGLEAGRLGWRAIRNLEERKLDRVDDCPEISRDCNGCGHCAMRLLIAWESEKEKSC